MSAEPRIISLSRPRPPVHGFDPAEAEPRASLAAMTMVGSAGRGRQLRTRGRPEYAPIGADTPWIDPQDAVLDHDPSLAVIADAWRTNGKTEHASVAAFAELSIDLISLGAPP